MSSSRFCYSKRQKMNLFESPFISLFPSQKPQTSTILSSIHHHVTPNFNKFFYFETFSPAYFQLKLCVLQTSKNTSISTHFDRPISGSLLSYFKCQKMFLFESSYMTLQMSFIWWFFISKHISSFNRQCSNCCNYICGINKHRKPICVPLSNCTRLLLIAYKTKTWHSTISKVLHHGPHLILYTTTQN